MRSWLRSSLVAALLLAWALPAQAAYSLCAHGIASGGSVVTSGAINTASSCAGATAADLLVIALSEYSGSAQPGQAPTDNQSNTWTKCGTTTSGGEADITIWYVQAPTTSASQTFSSANGTNPAAFLTMAILAFKGSTTTPCDQTNQAGSAVGGTSLATGSITPSAANELVITGISGGNGFSSPSVAGYTVSDSANYVNGTNEGGAAAYVIQTSASATNPSWSWTGSAVAAVAVASFKSSGGGGGGSPCAPTMTLLGVGRCGD